METILGVDIGGSHISAAQVDLEKRYLMKGTFVRKAIDADAAFEEVIESWARVIEAAMALHTVRPQKIGVAMPGPFDYAQGISLIRGQHKYDALFGLNVKELLARRLKIPSSYIRFMNDAACFLSGEAFAGGARGYRHVIGLTLGTGLGSAIYAKGVSSDAILWRAPFREGIAEDYISSRWFVRRYQELSGFRPEGVKEIADRLPDDPVSASLFREFGQTLAEFLNIYIAKEAPDAVLIGGNIARAFDTFSGPLKKGLSDMKIAICLASLGEEANIIGAARAWRESELVYE